MASDLFMDDFLFQDTDAFALPLLDFDPDGALLTPSELAMSQTHQQQTQHLPFPADDNADQQPTSPASTDDGSTDAEVSTPPSAFAPQRLMEPDAAASPAARVPLLLDSSLSTHSPLPGEQKLLASRASHGSSSSNRNAVMPTRTPTYTAKPLQPSKTLPMQMPPAAPFPGAVPYAMPVAFFQPLNANQKRPLPQVLPGAPSPSVATPASPSTATGAATASAPVAPAAPAPTGESDPNANKSKREIRQMKNRESANKSRLRRKAQLSTLTTEVTQLKQKEQELQTIIAGLRAENKSLLDQNTFLRSLVTNVKQEPRSNPCLAAFASLPPPPEQSCVALNMLESGQKMDVDSEPQTQAADVDLPMPRPGKRRAVSSTLSAASLAVCASVFGITIFADYDGDAVASGNVRGVGRVLHEAPMACGMDGCSSDAPTSLVGLVVAAVRSWWQFMSSSELVFGVLLNVLSFIAIVAVYQLWQAHSVGEWAWKSPGLSTPVRRDVDHQASVQASSSAPAGEKKTRGVWRAKNSK